MRESLQMTKEKITPGTRNVFADLGYPDAAERQTKVRLAVALNKLLAKRRLKQADAACRSPKSRRARIITSPVFLSSA